MNTSRRSMRPAVMAAAVMATVLCAQQPGTSPAPPPAAPEVSASDMQRLEQELAAQEARIEELEKQLVVPAVAPPPNGAAVPAVSTTAGSTPGSFQPASQPGPGDTDPHDHMMDLPGGPVLHIRGFFDFDFDTGSVAQNLQYPLGVPATSSFRTGEFDLFMSSQLSESLSFIAEMVTATDPTNNFEVDLERYQLTYRPIKYFEISAGRYHTSIGYYNTAYHHGTWFSTATGRPFMYYFEDSGGVLPVHEVGLTSTGYIPSGSFNLHWVAEIGNGRADAGSLFGDGVENFASDRNHKDTNFALYARPEWAPGLQVGGSFLTGDLAPVGLPKVNQTVSSLYAVFINPKWEFLNEAVVMHHHVTGSGGPTYDSPMGYTQLAYHIGKYRPYFRFQEVNVPNNDPVSPFVGRYEGPSVGVRMDFFDYACIKLQYNRVYLRNAPTQNGFEAALAYTF